MKLREYANLIGVSYRTAWQMFHEGNLPAEARQCKKSGSIIVLVSTYGAVLDAARSLPKSDQERLVRELQKDRNQSTP